MATGKGDGKGSGRRPGIGFSANYKGGRVKGGSWTQDPVTGKLVPKGDFVPQTHNAPAVHGDMQSFVSPITKELITCRGQLRRHNKKHGVTNSADYSADFMDKRNTARINESIGNTPRAKAERIAMLNDQLTKAGVR